jgi:predicted porin
MLNDSLTKRTSVYVQDAYRHATHGSTGSNFDNANIIYSPGPSSGVNRMVYRVGMIHTF